MQPRSPEPTRYPGPPHIGGARRFAGPPTSFIVITVALIQMVGTLFSASHQNAPRPLDALAILLLLAGPVGLAFRKRSPQMMLPVALAATGSYLALGYAWGPIVLSLALAIVMTAAAGLRWQAWAGAGLAAAAVITGAALTWDEDWPLRASAGVAWAAILVLIGQGFRRRSERLAEYRRRREEAQKAERDEYRLTLARDIHDVVAHSLSMINVQASVALHVGADDPEKLRPALEAIKAASKESLTEVRQLLGVLREDVPLAPAARPSLARIPELAKNTELSGLRVTLEDYSTHQAVGPAQQEAAYRIIQEALTNVGRHSGARSAVVRVVQTAGALTVTIDDDGAGMAGALPGNGLTGMRERAVALGGTLTLHELEPGLRVEATLPIQHEGTRP
ncbi:sensor histidine kinase [Paenarthrobacter aurescens]|uniref:histidine kinase n=1 Tax=Paenarthrobacter aurescens TaxID=43663 RepID=A0A4Y3NAY5_PAEAU|nr:sensor histidine kinase [Paenarthrobacter aurescens]MDO6142785.1 sensor histidine kinase [Paenarthrobacter aurescens]MDO6146631.1 sensor histidine kinase [Paenarthrobacter aurescens]MDO6157877.1 sensor histidine kinase [Paenarthrobacter aurescens]MDO6161861.1 sensor histidine kinase [Paenarthrobacter aurescens]GEB18812.1 two-component sensor histidine kinase [Paenarthrobacter aurescens]